MRRQDHPLFFAMADGVLRRVGVLAGFYLHKNERGALPGDDIDFAVLGTVAGGHDPVTERSDVINGQDLGPAAECQKAMEKKRKRQGPTYAPQSPRKWCRRRNPLVLRRSPETEKGQWPI